MDWYRTWDSEREMPKAQHAVTKALRVLAGLGAAAGVLALPLYGFGSGIPYLVACFTGALWTWASALCVDALIFGARLQVDWFNRHTKEIQRTAQRDAGVDKAEAERLAG